MGAKRALAYNFIKIKSQFKKKGDQMEKRLNEFIRKLANTKVNNCSFNQYSNCRQENEIRRNNLRIYLKLMHQVKPDTILIGEAPGYKGCRLTGIPFTSEYIMMNGVKGINVFGRNHGYEVECKDKKLEKENTAKFICDALREKSKIPLFWNAYPFHPFKENNKESNRAPRIEEILEGQRFLKDIIDMFSIKLIIAVGNNAENSLKRMKINFSKVRHPSYGGKMEFIDGINSLIL